MEASIHARPKGASRITYSAFIATAVLVGAVLDITPAQRQLGNVGGDPPRFVVQ
jgi:hypothetical protein